MRAFQVEAPDAGPHRGCTIFTVSAGLAVDNNGLPTIELALRYDLPPFPKDVIMPTLRDCAIVEEAIVYTTMAPLFRY